VTKLETNWGHYHRHFTANITAIVVSPQYQVALLERTRQVIDKGTNGLLKLIHVICLRGSLHTIGFRAMQQFLYLVFCYHLTSSSSFLQGIAKTSFSSALASCVISTYFS
jgi:hypothetical protein